MKPILSIEKRLTAAEKNESKRGKSLVLNYGSRANRLAYYLSNYMPNEDPNVFELHWSDQPPINDALKLRLLAQLTYEQIDEVRAIWVKSNWIRDKVALKELERLLAGRNQNRFYRKYPGE